MAKELIINDVPHKKNGIVFMRVMKYDISSKVLQDIANDLGKVLKPYDLDLIVSNSNFDLMGVNELREWLSIFMKRLEEVIENDSNNS